MNKIIVFSLTILFFTNQIFCAALTEEVKIVVSDATSLSEEDKSLINNKILELFSKEALIKEVNTFIPKQFKFNNWVDTYLGKLFDELDKDIQSDNFKQKVTKIFLSKLSTHELHIWLNNKDIYLGAGFDSRVKGAIKEVKDKLITPLLYTKMISGRNNILLALLTSNLSDSKLHRSKL